MESYTIQEKVKLPSKGQIYENCSEEVSMRSMTTEEEMRRLSSKGTEYEKLCKIIDSCITDTMDISSYDMCVGDYQGLLYGLRTATYGSSCLNPSICPKCGKLNNHKVDLYNLTPIEFEGFKDEDFQVVLPRSRKTVVIKMQTPRTLDTIDKDIEDFNKKHPDNDLDMTVLFTLKHCIKSVDGSIYDPIKIESFLRKLPMADTNALIQRIVKINDKVGINTDIQETCDSCGYQYKSQFRITSEFFGPTID